MHDPDFLYVLSSSGLPDTAVPIAGLLTQGHCVTDSCASVGEGRVVSEDVETYRGRAQHARLAAKSAIDKQQRFIFEKLAASYEALANEAECSERDRLPAPIGHEAPTQ